MIRVVVVDDEELAEPGLGQVRWSGTAGLALTGTDQLAQVVLKELGVGGVLLSPKVTRLVADGGLDAAVGSAAAVQVDRLTERERAVLVLVADGLSNTDIAARMAVSAGTVKGHVSAILAKLRVGGRRQAALVAHRAGLLDTGEPQP